ncbi:RdgB/HAM1 family non-canonical purine NTP pyrophosphatase [Alphaproteobacteria bacterium]|nr:RdgB/HAM1 family non-canonical purine NTP pyrophosphatase [Alphaproteobacteria bacterium]
MKNRILLGTGNTGKIKEMLFYLEHFNIFQTFETLTPTDFKYLSEPIEDGTTFEENAKFKSNFFYEATNLLSLSDDSGLMIDKLNGYPGIKTARVAKDLGGEQKVIDYIFSKFENESQLKATFHCSIALIGDDKKLICSGKVQGSIIPTHRGDRGFGYDPYFIPENNSKTFAEMAVEEKMILSHRFNAFKILANQIL